MSHRFGLPGGFRYTPCSSPGQGHPGLPGLLQEATAASAETRGPRSNTWTLCPSYVASRVFSSFQPPGADDPHTPPSSARRASRSLAQGPRFGAGKADVVLTPTNPMAAARGFGDLPGQRTRARVTDGPTQNGRLSLQSHPGDCQRGEVLPGQSRSRGPWSPNSYEGDVAAGSS